MERMYEGEGNYWGFPIAGDRNPNSRGLTMVHSIPLRNGESHSTHLDNFNNT